MRLDHLLSKEHLKSSDFQSQTRDECSRLVSTWVEHLTSCRSALPLLSTALGSGTELDGTIDTCTLLGPEGPDAASAAAEPQGPSSMSQRGMREGYRPYFENYTVDASIFEMIHHLV